MKLLINLAHIDGKLASREAQYITNIGKANGFSTEEVKQMLEQQHELIVPDGLTSDEKFNYIYSLVQLMKIDERMYKEEILFCSTIASRLGYDKQVMFDLMFHIKGEEMEESELNSLKKLTENYLRK